MGYDLVTVGRANMDLYSVDVGRPFAKVRNFEAMVGGSPTNIAIAAQRLGLTTAAFTAVGSDVVGDFVLDYLADEGVAIEHVHRIESKMTSLALLGVQPPSRFPLLVYRDDPADIHLTPQHAAAISRETSRALQLSGNAFSRGSTAEVARHLASHRPPSVESVFVDLDLRPTDWEDPSHFGQAMRELIPLTDVAIGTEEEYAGVFLDPERPLGRPVNDVEIAEIDNHGAHLTSHEATALVAKRGPAGATVFIDGARTDVAGFAVEVVNTVGAGDAFAAGIIRSRLRGAGWEEALRFANGCGALQVTRHGCSAAFPTAREVDSFIAGAVGGHIG